MENTPEIRKSFLLRIDPQLWRDLQAWADDELRSVNGQIEFVLRRAVDARRKGTSPRKSPGADATSSRKS